MLNRNKACAMLIAALVGIGFSLMSFLMVILTGSAIGTENSAQESPGPDSI